MMPSARFTIAGMYRVEVSGWDENQAFFVEKSDLEWNADSGKFVVLCNALPDRTLVFLRLLQSIRPDRSHPVPYEAEFVSITPLGQRQFRLHPVSPRTVVRSSVH